MIDDAVIGWILLGVVIFTAGLGAWVTWQEAKDEEPK